MTATWHGLPARALLAWRLEAAAGVVVALGLCALVGWVWLELAWLRSALLVVAGVLVAWTALDIAVLLPRRHAAYRWSTDDGVLQVRRGVLVASELLVPIGQVLFVDVRRGPVVQALGLTRVRAGTVGSAHSIGPLTPDAAATLARTLGHGRS